MHSQTRRDVIVLGAAGLAGIGIAAAANNARAAKDSDAELLALFDQWCAAYLAYDKSDYVVEDRIAETFGVRPPHPEHRPFVKALETGIQKESETALAFIQRIGEQEREIEDAAKARWNEAVAKINAQYGIPALEAERTKLDKAQDGLRERILDMTPRTAKGIAAHIRATCYWPPLKDHIWASEPVSSDAEAAAWSAVEILESMAGSAQS